MTRTSRLTTALIASLCALTSCARGNVFDSGGDEGTIVVGSQDYYSNEIIAEIYAQALEKEGFAVERNMRIGQREVYLPELQAGSVDLLPEYTGPLLKYWTPEATATQSEEVYQELKNSTPPGVKVLDQAPAVDQDSYVVTQDFAHQWGLTTIEDLRKVTTPLLMGANSEAEQRPNGPQGLRDTYGVEVNFTPIEDSGGPLTVKALRDGQIQIGIIYTADPSIADNNLLSLTDTKGLFLASHVVPVASNAISEEAEAVVNKVSTKLTSEELIKLNRRSVNEQLPSATIAKDWLAENG